MEQTKHNYLVGESAEKLAVDMKLDLMDKSYFSTDKRRDQLMAAMESSTIANDHDLEVKKLISRNMGDRPPPSAYIASNTSSKNIDVNNLVRKTVIVEEASRKEKLAERDNIEVRLMVGAEEGEEGSTDSEVEERLIAVGEISIEEKAIRSEGEKQDALDALFPGSIGTVGCVCMFGGHVAAATSTGGLTNKMAGRIGELATLTAFTVL